MRVRLTVRVQGDTEDGGQGPIFPQLQGVTHGGRGRAGPLRGDAMSGCGLEGGAVVPVAHLAAGAGGRDPDLPLGLDRCDPELREWIPPDGWRCRYPRVRACFRYRAGPLGLGGWVGRRIGRGDTTVGGRIISIRLALLFRLIL